MKKIVFLLGSTVLAATIGCGPSKPDAVIAPPFDPGQISSAAMSNYDKNSDGKIDEEELKASPALSFSATGPNGIDTDADGAISKAELEARIQAWIDMKVALTCPILKFQDKKGKAPKDVVGKNVTLTPDPMMGDILKTTTPIAIDENGQCSPSTPDNQDGLGGMSYGFYSISIEGSKYSNLGVEIFDGAKASDMDSFIIELKKGK